MEGWLHVKHVQWLLNPFCEITQKQARFNKFKKKNFKMSELFCIQKYTRPNSKLGSTCHVFA